MECDFQTDSRKMVEEQLIIRGISSASVLEAMQNVPRHRFVPESMLRFAYDDSPLPIGLGQTISQPYIVAFMTEQLAPFPGMKILEIGTGSGYQAAILGYLGCSVYTIEVLEELAVEAKKTFAELGYANVTAKHGDGHIGWPEEAPFDAIIVTAAPEYIPDNLVEQLADCGRMIIPVGRIHFAQTLKLITRNAGAIIEKDLLPVRFVPMV